MSNRKPWAKWTLPDVIDPPDRLCFTVPVPNNPLHLAAFRGALLSLASATKWQDDDAHTAKAVALVWKEIYDLVVACTDAAAATYTEDDNMALTRVVCVNNVAYFEVQTCACPETWLRLANASQIVNPGQPGSGQTTPAAGASTQYCVTVPASGQILIPALVNTGDQITLDSISGSWWDGAESDFGPLYRFGENGDQMVAGIDVGFPRTSGADFMPAVNHMKLIAAVGATPTYMTLTKATPVTVPAVAANSQIVLIPNRTAALRAGSQGECQACITVKNNSTSVWCHIDNMLTSSNLWTNFTDTFITVPTGHWTLGTGWVGEVKTQSGGSHRNSVYIQAPYASLTAQSIEIEYAFTAGQVVLANDKVLEIQSGASGLVAYNPVPDAAIATYTFTGPFTVNPLVIYLDIARQNGADPSPAGSGAIRKVTYRGTGTNPFGSSNC